MRSRLGTTDRITTISRSNKMKKKILHISYLLYLALASACTSDPVPPLEPRARITLTVQSGPTAKAPGESDIRNVSAWLYANQAAYQNGLPAEAFARGGAALLEASGCVDVLSFGSEAGDLSPLTAAAACLDSEAWKRELRAALDRGLPFPAARQRAAEAIIGPDAACLASPNNNLGVEYLRALRALNSRIVPHTLPRLGAGHDEEAEARRSRQRR